MSAVRRSFQWAAQIRAVEPSAWDTLTSSFCLSSARAVAWSFLSTASTSRSSGPEAAEVGPINRGTMHQNAAVTSLFILVSPRNWTAEATDLAHSYSVVSM